MSGVPKEKILYFPTPSGVYTCKSTDVLGKGTYGIVYKVTLQDNPSVERAVKLFLAETIEENEGIPSTTLREINAVKSINHPNVISIKHTVMPVPGQIDDMFIVMELCKGTLRDRVNSLIQQYLAKDTRWVNAHEGDRLPAEYVHECKVIAWEILNAVAVCHSHGIMHRDLKPANILWGQDGLLKVADFGLARFVRGKALSEDHVIPQTGEVQTMWYRAPEVLLGDEKYGLLVDDWSVGCIIAELFLFRMSNTNKRMECSPLFPGRGDVHTFMLVLESLGSNFDSYLTKLPYYSAMFPKWVQPNLRKKLCLLDDTGFNLISQLLTMSPANRKASRYLLYHPWFNDIKPRLSRLTPWYRGSEREFLRLLEIGRLPRARMLSSVKSENKENYPEN